MAKMDLNNDDEKVNIETIFWSAMDMLSDDDKKLPQVSILYLFLISRIAEIYYVVTVKHWDTLLTNHSFYFLMSFCFTIFPWYQRWQLIQLWEKIIVSYFRSMEEYFLITDFYILNCRFQICFLY